MHQYDIIDEESGRKLLGHGNQKERQGLELG
jgi:hypothetical protein